MKMIDVRKYLKEKKLVIGTKETFSELRLGKLQSVLLSSNCPEGVKRDFERFCNISGCKIEQLAIPNDELGVLCRKQFSVSVLGLLK